MRGLALLLLVAACAPAGAQQPPDRNTFFGAGSCAAQACHGGGSAERQEYKIWATKDRHAKAFDSLSGELGRRIGERLGIDPAKSDACLSCHGVTGMRTAATFDPHDGVSCELCHGAAGRWLGPHAAPGFKEKLAVDKEQLGLLDLTTPAKRAARCVTCHVGGEGRDVSHAMMAAGHPPLVFSLARFTDAMPPHWKEETPKDLASFEAGAKAAAVARLRQVARMASVDGKVWPEFAAFDCYGCHQEIRKGGAGGAGHLPLDVSPLVVLAAGDPGLAQGLAGILGATYAPGAPRGDLADWAERAARDVERLGPAAPDAFAKNLDAWLARAEAGEIRIGFSAMQQVALAAYALAGDPGAAAFAEAYRALDEALARPYDDAACAALARRALAAR